MRQMFVFPFATGIILTTVSVALAAPVQGAPNGTNTGKSLYSSRPKTISANSSFATQQPQAVVEQPRQFVVENDDVIEVAPSYRRAPMPPTVPQRSEHLPLVISDDLGFEIVSPGNTVGETIISDRPLHVETDADCKPSLEQALERPLSGIEIPSKTVETVQTMPVQTPIQTRTKGPWTSAPAQALTNRPLNTVPSAAASKTVSLTEPMEVDQFNARLAKIQLEKKNLDETLNLIQKIQSPNFKVKTLVDLAEYVSRDSNYKKEADRLYDLAVAGIDALASGKPVEVSTLKPLQSISVIAPKTEATPTLPQSTKLTTKPKLTLAEENEPVVIDTKSVKSTEPKLPTPPAPKLEFKEEAKEIQPKLDDVAKTSEDEEKKLVDQSDAPKPAALKRPTLTLLDDESDKTMDKPLLSEEKKEPTLAPPKSSRSRLSLIDEPEDGQKVEEPKKPEETKKEEKEIGELPTLPAIPKKSEPEIKKDELTFPSLKKEETKKENEPKQPSRRSLLDLDEDESVEPIVRPKRNADAEETLETVEKNSKDIELESPKPKRRPMPRKKIVLED